MSFSVIRRKRDCLLDFMFDRVDVFIAENIPVKKIPFHARNRVAPKIVFEVLGVTVFSLIVR